MKVESIAKFCNTFDLHQAFIGLENHFVVVLRVAVLHKFFCILVLYNKQITMYTSTTTSK